MHSQWHALVLTDAANAAVVVTAVAKAVAIISNHPMLDSKVQAQQNNLLRALNNLHVNAMHNKLHDHALIGQPGKTRRIASLTKDNC